MADGSLCALMDLLGQNQEFLSRGFVAYLGPDGRTIIIEKHGHVRAFWRAAGEELDWTPGG
jgi:hypothetical protein